MGGTRMIRRRRRKGELGVGEAVVAGRGNGFCTPVGMWWIVFAGYQVAGTGPEGVTGVDALLLSHRLPGCGCEYPLRCPPRRRVLQRVCGGGW